MILKTDVADFVVHFHHGRELMNGQWITTAIVHPAPCVKKGSFPCDTDPVSYGEALCNPIDRFSKATGRKIALSRAIEDFNRETRTQIWLQYWAYVAPKG